MRPLVTTPRRERTAPSLKKEGSFVCGGYPPQMRRDGAEATGWW